MMATKSLRIMVVDDNRIIREGLTIFLRIFDDLEFVGEADSGKNAIKQCDALQPDVILMDIMMPEVNGIEATKVIKAKYPQVKIVGLTSFSSEEMQVRGMLDAGAAACLPKQASIDEIVSAIRGY